MAEKVADPAKAGLREQIVAELQKETDKAVAAEAATEGDDTEGEDTGDALGREPEAEKTPEPAAKAKEDDAPPEPKVARGFADLAKREADGRKAYETRKAELKAYEDGLVQRTAQIETQARTQAQADLYQRLIQDPVGTFKALGIKQGFKDIGAQFYYEELGDSAPPEVRGKRELYGVQAQVNEIKRTFQDELQKLQQQNQQLQTERLVEQYRAGLVAALPTLPEKLTYFRALANSDARQATDYMLAAANDYARTHPGEPPATASVLAETVEQALQERLKPFAGVLPKKPSPAADETDSATTTLTNTHTGRTSAKTTPKSRDEVRAETIRELESRAARSE